MPTHGARAASEERTKIVNIENPSISSRPKAIALLSGGLDSTLAIQLLLDQGIEVLAVNFVSPFCTCTPRREGSCHLATEVARSLKVPIRVFNKGMDYLRIVEKPRHGRGKGLNPCIDCRIYILRKAAELLPEENASFVVTGEVLGQRPMSQHRRALDLIERESGLSGRILRPLSARVMEPTLPEIQGLVDREKLLAITGRSRHAQLELARQQHVEIFGCPAGGCLLTDPNIAGRLQDLFEHCPDYDMTDAKICTFGRHFRLHAGLKVVIGRDQKEDERLQLLAGKRQVMELVDRPGPLMLIRGTANAGDFETLGRLLRSYAKHIDLVEEPATLTQEEQVVTISIGGQATEAELSEWRI